ncbi:hypothetical protein FB451DRAFT_1408377 [Mycena latifolia]|nr:hypothetical protein FB451DRAFT_1408377 [Mycena latifolia]
MNPAATRPKRAITAFRSSIYLPTYAASNAHMFITNDWIDAEQLSRVKLEDDASATRLSTSEEAIPPVDFPSVITRIPKEGNRFEILSDSDSDSEENGLCSERGGHDSGQEISDPRESSPLPPLPPSDMPSETSYQTDFVCSIRLNLDFTSPAESTPNFGGFTDFDLSFLIPSVPFRRKTLIQNSNSLNSILVLLNSMDIDFSFFQQPDSGTQFSVPPHPSTSLPRLPPIPTSSPISPTPEPVTAHVDQVSATGSESKKRKSQDDVGPVNVIHMPRARKVRKRADAQGPQMRTIDVQLTSLPRTFLH